MKKIILICSKELGTFLTSPMAYIVSAIFIGLSGASFTTYPVSYTHLTLPTKRIV